MPVFENTAPRRKKEVTKEQFKALKGRLSLEYNYAARGIDPQAVKAWNSYIPLSPKVAFNMLTRGLPKGTVVEISPLDIEGTGSLQITKDDEDAGGTLLEDNRTFNLLAHEVGMGYVEVTSRARGQGLGRHLMRNQIEFFHACGVNRFNILASSSNGGYTWARMGFLPRDHRDGKFRAKLALEIENTLDKLWPVLDARTVAQVRDYIKFAKPTDLWKLADMNIDMAPLLVKAIDGRGGLPRWRREALRDAVGVNFRAMAKDGQALPLGRLLLTGTSWDGTLDLTNARQMKRIARYSGGFEFIKL